jgi:hypothetical protein
LLFISATRLKTSRFLNLWRLTNEVLIISPYVIHEALDHLQGPVLLRFEVLFEQMERVEDPDSSDLPFGITVVERTSLSRRPLYPHAPTFSSQETRTTSDISTEPGSTPQPSSRQEPS